MGGQAGSAGTQGSGVGAAGGRLPFPAPSRPWPFGLRPPGEEPQILPGPAGWAGRWGQGLRALSCRIPYLLLLPA